jgi:hypothetical protein
MPVHGSFLYMMAHSFMPTWKGGSKKKFLGYMEETHKFTQVINHDKIEHD